MSTKARTNPIRLHFESTEQVMVVPDDKDRFMITAGDAARACQQAESDREWDKQWNELLYFVHEWCKRHEDSVSEGYVTVGDSALNVIVGVHGEYDFDLEDTLADFDLELTEKFPLCRTEVLQIPNQTELKAGLPHRAIKVYGDGKRAPASGRA